LLLFLMVVSLCGTTTAPFLKNYVQNYIDLPQRSLDKY
jgi:hypothetical protein